METGMAFDHFEMMHKVTQIASKGAKPSIKPFVEYLRAGRPFNDSVRRWLLALLSDKGWHGARLLLQLKPGRATTTADFARNWEAYEFYNDMRERRITRQLCEQYAAGINAGPIKFFTEQKAARYGGHKIGRTVYTVGKSPKAVKLVKGQPIPNYVALALTAKRYNRPADTLRKVIKQFELAKAADEKL
jgi:hypothetical protein